MASFTHFLLTRFNLLHPGVVLDDSWYKQRFALFERFCLPAVQGQTNQSFCWMIFADRRTPDIFRARIDAYQSYANLEVSYLDGPDRAEMVRAVRARLEKPATHLLTTTLDNDDAIARDYVAQVQAQFAAQPFELVNFVHGLRLDLVQHKLYACDLETNPFISLIEEIGPQRRVRTIAGCLPHSQIKARFSPIRNVSAAPLWLQVVHGRNVAPTGTWGRPRVALRRLDDYFALEYDLQAAADAEGSFRVQHARARLERGLINTLSGAQRERLGEWLRRVRR